MENVYIVEVVSPKSQIKLQAGCLPVRRGKSGIKVLLVTSKYTGQWIAPKGGIEEGETPAEAATREAAEEAGVSGRILGRLGSFDYNRGGGECRVEAFALLVTEQYDDWPERQQRRRKWFKLKRALNVVHRSEALGMLKALKKGSFLDEPEQK